MSVPAIAIGDAAADAAVALVVRAQAGDRLAFEQLIGPGSIASSGWPSRSWTKSDARDVVQEGCLLAWRQLPRLRGADRFEAWLWQTRQRDQRQPVADA